MVNKPCKVINSGSTYSSYKKLLGLFITELADEAVTYGLLQEISYKNRATPNNGDEGVCIAKRKHEFGDSDIYLVKINGQLYTIGESGIELMKRGTNKKVTFDDLINM